MELSLLDIMICTLFSVAIMCILIGILRWYE